MSSSLGKTAAIQHAFKSQKPTRARLGLLLPLLLLALAPVASVALASTSIPCLLVIALLITACSVPLLLLAIAILGPLRLATVALSCVGIIHFHNLL